MPAFHLLSKISKHERAATNLRVRVSLHHFQLFEIGDATTRQRVPIDREVIERCGRAREPDSGIEWDEINELPTAESLQRRARLPRFHTSANVGHSHRETVVQRGTAEP